MAIGRILVIDDDPDNREIIDFNLTRDGFQVACAADASEGYCKLRAGQVDLIILDLVMPGVDGIELCRQLKAEPGTRGIPVIMVTAKNDESDIVLGLGIGADDYISKPFSSKELIARVRAVLRRGPVSDNALLKLAEMQSYVHRLEQMLGIETDDPDDDILSLAPNGVVGKPVLETFASPIKEKESHFIFSAESETKSEGEEIHPCREAVEEMEELERRVFSLRRAHADAADLRIKFTEGSETLSLHYYSVPNGGKERMKVIDLERLVLCQRLALEGALKLTGKLYHDADKPHRKAVLMRVRLFLLRLFENARDMLSPEGCALLPYAGDKINNCVLFNFAAMLNLHEWESADDVEQYRELFNARLEWPLTELLENPSERRMYLESILSPAAGQAR